MDRDYKACPFCGETKDLMIAEAALVAEDENMEDFNIQKWVECQNCGALGPPTDRREEAVKSWNERRQKKLAPHIQKIRNGYGKKFDGRR